MFRTGNGPSSSHTMGPKKAAKRFLSKTPGASSYQVTLYGSLAATGRGHPTDVPYRKRWVLTE
ncbi:serine dehydratase beta chain [Prolixibacter sp. SD074]|uniref:serine dehydratase beta chain n=1 Tax=Prolixibacter sp. SD074 TaxID=2652391 RepID=UPI0035A344C3